MTRIIKKFSFAHVPPVFKRGHQVMLAIFDPDNRLYLARKRIYPIDIYRFFGGGVEAGETTAQAATRECREETGLSIPLVFQQTFVVNFDETSTQQSYQYQADVYYAHLQFQYITPGDDVDGLKLFSRSDYRNLINLYEELSSDLFLGKDAETFSWHDWGAVFNELNKYVLDHWPQD